MVTNILIVIVLIFQAYLGWKFLSKKPEVKTEIQPIYNNNPVDLTPIKKVLDEVPAKVLETIKGSTNNLKGDLGEMIGYLKLHSSYDRIIPFGNITDFICIRFPKDGDPGTLDFIDIKTGSARLSKDQRSLQKLIEDKQIRLLKLKVETSSADNNK
jgi:predicted Holliday junction resolvase-like endonuclease